MHGCARNSIICSSTQSSPSGVQRLGADAMHMLYKYAYVSCYERVDHVPWATREQSQRGVLVLTDSIKGWLYVSMACRLRLRAGQAGTQLARPTECVARVSMMPGASMALRPFPS